VFFFSSRRRHTRFSRDWSSDVCSSDLEITPVVTCLQIAIVIGVIVFAVRSVRSPWYALALGLIMGGALGNIHDRLLRAPGPFHRSEERRVGKGCGARGAPEQQNNKTRE